MGLNISIALVELRDDLTLDVIVGASVRGFEPSISYDGEINVVNGGPKDSVPISGVVGTGAGEEHHVNLDPGLSAEDLPETVLITAAVEASGTPYTDQIELELDTTNDDQEPVITLPNRFLTPRNVAIGGAVVLGGILLRRAS